MSVDINAYPTAKEVESSKYFTLIESIRNKRKYKIRLDDFIDDILPAVATGGNIANTDLTADGARIFDVDGNNFDIRDTSFSFIDWNSSTPQLILRGASSLCSINMNGNTPSINFAAGTGGDKLCVDTDGVLVHRGGDFRIEAVDLGVLTFATPSTVTDYSITMPSTQGEGPLSNNGSGTLTWGNEQFLRTSAVQTANFTAVAGSLYLLDTNSSGITVTPPTSPTQGQRFGVVDARSTFDTNNCIISFDTNGSTRYNANAADLTISTEGSLTIWEYFDATYGWVLVGGSL